MTRTTGPTQKQRGAVKARSNGHCERCWQTAVQIHHRKPRKLGGTRRTEINNLSNLVALCLDCHQWVESYRATARATGWLVPEWADPASVPLIDLGGTTRQLDDDGGVTLLPIPAGWFIDHLAPDPDKLIDPNVIHDAVLVEDGAE